MEPFAASRIERSASLYVGFVDESRAERHLSYIPQIPGLEALCGQALAGTVLLEKDIQWFDVPTCAKCAFESSRAASSRR